MAPYKSLYKMTQVNADITLHMQIDMVTDIVYINMFVKIRNKTKKTCIITILEVIPSHV